MNRTLTRRRYSCSENSDNKDQKQGIIASAWGRTSSPICLGSKVNGGITVGIMIIKITMDSEGHVTLLQDELTGDSDD